MGLYCSCLLPWQDGGTSQIQFNGRFLPKQICHPVLPIPDFGAGGTVQRAEQPLRPRRGLPPAKENRRVRCQVGDFGTLAQTPLALKAFEIKENNAILHLTDDNIILYPLLPSETLDQ